MRGNDVGAACSTEMQDALQGTEGGTGAWQTTLSTEINTAVIFKKNRIYP